MALLKGKARQSTAVETVGEGVDVYLKALRDGSMSAADVVTGWSLEGRVFTINAGTVTTPITFGAGDITETEHDCLVTANSGFQLVPLSIQLCMEAYGTTAIFQYMAKVGAGATAGAGTSVTPECTNRAIDRGSSATCTVAATVTSGVGMTSGHEFWRGGSQKTVTRATVTEALQDPMNFYWSWKNDGILHVGSQIAIYAASQAGTGFIVLTYAEIPTGRIE